MVKILIKNNGGIIFKNCEVTHQEKLLQNLKVKFKKSLIRALILSRYIIVSTIENVYTDDGIEIFNCKSFLEIIWIKAVFPLIFSHMAQTRKNFHHLVQKLPLKYEDGIFRSPPRRAL